MIVSRQPLTRQNLLSGITARKRKRKKSEISGSSLELFLEFLEFLLGVFAARSRLLRELFCLRLLRLVQLD